MSRRIQIFIILLTLSFGCATTQTVKINFIFFNPCDSIFEYDLMGHSLLKDGKEFKSSGTLGTIHLPSVGKYSLKLQASDFYSVSDSIIDVRKNGQNYDTLTRAKIIVCSGPMHGPPCGYTCCDNLCNGYNVDYYENGNKMIEGNFINGQPIGQLILYYPNGDKKEIHFYDLDGKGIMEKKQSFDRSISN